MSSAATPTVPVQSGSEPQGEVPSVRVPRTAISLRKCMLLAPALLVLGVFAVALLDLLNWSFYSEGKLGAERVGSIGWTSYARILRDSLYMGTILATVRLSAVATICSLALGLPVAYWIVRTESRRVRALLIILVAVPFMTSLIVRLYALLLVLGNSGLVNTLLQAAGWIAENDFIALVRNEVGVSIGLTYFVLPFVIFTLAGSFRRYDRTLEDAAQNLGADEVVTFLRITLPLLAPGVLAACTLAFVLAGTAFATPLILGGSAVRMVGNVIYDQAMFAQNMPMAAALSVLALLFTVACLYAAGRLSQRRSHA
ncbi:ABC transporter permease [Variovorax sp. Sphag1AA]|uniref:ABC transporter permease n=1 Tax=Variovorax sp. Sphag1AA TaxID=2587027 RepID=UPI00160EE63E|nr:ABC transporter permease [Variovorax sp. Sphag1AA]MBB3182425.1 ABC-type spermidine/putrescine transport system permease subunit I [Variovorax sp. Sphag1AA]